MPLSLSPADTDQGDYSDARALARCATSIEDVASDRRLVTGQNPSSATGVARELARLLC
jgi:putative intracellular protease/amidase